MKNLLQYRLKQDSPKRIARDVVRNLIVENRRDNMGGPCFYCTIRKLGCHDKCKKYQIYKSSLKKRDGTEEDFLNYSYKAVGRMGSEGRRI